ncbi:hypothetical protein HLH33_17310 [Gluconacetobacter diazotrophicus]|uniref:Uncharacterized protein n=1 Tax=Gluconacetobacter diazotrophicus TaxID=33996 RepID=A0A7W4I833_GLUDI|nr:hypothetical protein [Gluconacetobacter diazotrophicus]MBB2158031.1 hypothetical protein [Gluconacetobacter diazotrophicus]
MDIILTVGDHEKNGFVALARWPGLAEAEARQVIGRMDAQVIPDAEPDNATAAFAFILDLWDRGDLIDTGKRLLPLQDAMRIAQEPVSRWLSERPEPDDVLHRAVPALPRSSLPLV